MPNTTKQDLMDDYVMGRLSDSQRKLLEQMIADDPRFQVELDMHQDIADSSTLLGNKDLRAMLDGIHKKVVSGKVKNEQGWIKQAIIGIGMLAALIAVYFASTLARETRSTEQLRYASYYSIDEGAARAGNGSIDESSNAYVAAYKTKDFAKVLEILTPKLENADNETRLVAAIAALEIGDKDLARAQLRKITVSDDFYYVDHAKWFTALLEIQEDNISAAKKLLEQLISDPKADHHVDAKDLLVKLK